MTAISETTPTACREAILPRRHASLSASPEKTMTNPTRTAELLATAVEQAAEMIIITATDGTIQYVNPAFERITGYRRDEAIGQSAFMLHSGSQDLAFYDQLWDGLKRGEVWSGRLCNRRKDGTCYEAKSTISPVRDGTGSIVNYVSVESDITQELALETQLRQAQKLESIGQLAAGIAHEINTPTQYVGDNTRFVRDSFEGLLQLVEAYGELAESVRRGEASPAMVARIDEIAAEVDMEFLSEEVPKAIEESLEGVERVTKIVRAMKEFSHPGVQEKVPVDLNRAIETTITVARNEWKYVADLETDFDETIPQVPCLPGDINQVFLNIIINASHAIGDVVEAAGEGKGRIDINTRRDGKWVEIRIRDTGGGIPEAVRSRVFDPFFTTKEVGKGTGQGLAISHSVVVDKHSGQLTFETEAGKGTTFIIRLPILPKAA